MPAKNKYIIAGLLFLFVVTGFFRESVFLNLNEQMRVTYYHSPDPHVDPYMQWLGTFSYITLYYIKWPLTLLFSAIFAFYSILVIRFAFRSKPYERITWYAYGCVFAASVLFFFAGYLTGTREATYVISRFLAGLIETPALLIILMASFMVHRRL